VYDSVVEHERLAGVLGRLIWGTDTSAFYREIARLAEEPDGTVILDVPCGGGVAFRGLRPRQRVRHVAGDPSPVMLRRARAEAKRRELDQIEFTQPTSLLRLAKQVAAEVDGAPFQLVSMKAGPLSSPPCQIPDTSSVELPGERCHVKRQRARFTLCERHRLLARLT
jgi:SAM-dependent methyltransferase